jgi:hypothetical protein
MRHAQTALHVEEVEGRGSITPDATGASGRLLHNLYSGRLGLLHAWPRTTYASRVQTAHAASW